MSEVTSIPGVAAVHPRSSWVDPRFPVFGPETDWSAIDAAVVHYTAADDLIDGDPGEHADDLPAYLRNIQKSYTLNRGYSIGYWFAVDWLGGVWQLRGWEYRSAANAGHNDHTCPILVLVDGDDSATSEAVSSIRAIIAEAGRKAARPLSILGHRDIGSTSCPGVGLYTQVRAGVFTPQPPLEEDDMPIVTTWEGEPWPILVGYDPASASYAWRGIPADQVTGLLARNAATDGRTTPWPQAWKNSAWVKRLG